MPMKSTGEMLDSLQDVLDEFYNRCSPVEVIGALAWLQYRVSVQAQEDGDEEDLEGEEWKHA